MTRIPVVGVSKTLGAMGSEPLDVDEIESLTTASAAYMYEQGGHLSGKIMLAMAVAGIALPRLHKYFADKGRAKSLTSQLTASQAANSAQSTVAVQASTPA